MTSGGSWSMTAGVEDWSLRICFYLGKETSVFTSCAEGAGKAGTFENTEEREYKRWKTVLVLGETGRADGIEVTSGGSGLKQDKGTFQLLTLERRSERRS